MTRYLFTDEAVTGARATAIDDTGRVFDLLILDVGRVDDVVGLIDVEVFAQGAAWRGQVDVYTDQADERDAAVLTVPEFGESWSRDLRTFVIAGGAR